MNINEGTKKEIIDISGRLEKITQTKRDFVSGALFALEWLEQKAAEETKKPA